MSIKNGKLLYHLTSIENLDSIIRNGLLPRSQILNFKDIANQDIIDFRNAVQLSNYVPFHFFAKKPFDGRVQKDHPDQNFIYICVSRKYAKDNNFRVVTMHPRALDELILHDYEDGFNLIDWDTMDIRDYEDDYNRHVCMAECLSPTPIDPSDFFCIYVKDSATKSIVTEVTLKYYESIPFYIGAFCKIHFLIRRDKFEGVLA